jgi:hypothetical protein
VEFPRVIASWISFAAGYVLGGLSGIMVLGFFIAGSRGESIGEVPRSAETKTHNSVVKFDLVPNTGAASASRQLPDQPA